MISDKDKQFIHNDTRCTQGQIKRVFALKYLHGLSTPKLDRIIKKITTKYKTWDISDLDTYQIQEIYKLIEENGK